MNQLTHLRSDAAVAVRRPQVGLAAGLLVAALAGAPMPLPELALLGPWIAYSAVGKPGAQASAAVGFASFALLAHAAPLALLAAALLSAGVAWGIPALMENFSRQDAERTDDSGASAVMIDCEGFASLDESYGPGTGDVVFSMLQRALETETRDADLVVHVQNREMALVLDGSSPEMAQSVMARVERRFSQMLADAGYECNLSVDLSGVDDGEDEYDRLLRSARSECGPYLD